MPAQKSLSFSSYSAENYKDDCSHDESFDNVVIYCVALELSLAARALAGLLSFVIRK